MSFPHDHPTPHEQPPKGASIKPVRAAIIRAGIEALGGPDALLERAQAAVTAGRLQPKAYYWLGMTIEDVGFDR